MSQDISGFGTVVNLIASNTFPAGIMITELADDSDPLDFAAVQIADKAMGANGDLLVWAKANPLPMVINVVAGSNDDVNLTILANNNRVAQGKTSSADVIYATVIYPDGSVSTRVQGRITDAMFGKSIAGTSFRLKTKSFTFCFQDGTDS
jgi:hypothetical protein